MEIKNIAICMLIAIATFLLWEGVAWFTHKFVMHGVLWKWHKSHHTVHDHALEKNDLFALVFSVPSIGLFYYFSQVHFSPYMISVATGIFLYGVFYFIFDDVVVHQRVKCRLKGHSPYLQRMIQAHYVHHSKHSKDGCEAFGFLYAPRKYASKKFTFKPQRSDTQ